MNKVRAQIKAVITIRDNGERLVDVRKYCPNVVIRLGRRRMKQERTAYLRASVAKMLREATKYLPKGLRFVINDAWRSSYVQCGIYFDFIKKGQRRYQGLKGPALIKEIEKYVAPWSGVNASGHMSGGAIDLRIVDSRGHKIPMRSKSLDYRQNALSNQPLLPAAQRKNRAILADAMLRAGFSNYPLEYWHWSYGDIQWARRNKLKTARYGAVADVKGIYAQELCPCGATHADGRSKKFNHCHGK
ncbi:MAG: M15 family metallopeptidase [Patescibacteria group bacterium]